MCFNEEVSWLTLIVGTALNIFALTKLSGNKTDDATTAKIIILMWQFVILMQLVDALAWRQIKNNNSTEGVGRLGAILNIAQPIIVFICAVAIIHFTNKDFRLLIPGIIILIFYIINIFQNLNKLNYDITPNGNCNNINYSWWESLSVYLYIGALFAIVLVLQNSRFTLLNLGIIFITLLVSLILVPTCNFGSLWCWTVWAAGFLNYLIV